MSDYRARADVVQLGYSRLLTQYRSDLEQNLGGVAPTLISLTTEDLELSTVSPFYIPPTYASLAASGLFQSEAQEWWDFYYYGVNTILENSTAQVGLTDGNIANGSHTIYMTFTVPNINAFTQIIKPAVPLQSVITCWASEPFGPGIQINRVGTTGWNISAGGATSATYAFGETAFVAMSSGPSTVCRVRFKNEAVTADTGNGNSNTGKAHFDAIDPFPPGGGAFPNLTGVTFGATPITNAWHYWGLAFSALELEELGDWVEAGNPVVP